MVNKEEILSSDDNNNSIKQEKEIEGKLRIGWEEDFKKKTKNGKVKNEILIEDIKNDFDDEEWKF